MGERTTAKRSDGREQPTPKQAEVNRRRIAKAIRDNPEKSDRQIAKEMGVSHPTVAKVREEVLNEGGNDDSESSLPPETESPQDAEPIASDPATEPEQEQQEAVVDEPETNPESVADDSESSATPEEEQESPQETEPVADNPATDTSIGIPITPEPEHEQTT